jgi:LiaF transmembrane domain
MTSQPPVAPRPHMEKAEEKEEEKRHEKGPEEKNWDEKWRRDPLGSLFWALILIWAGVALLLNNMGLVTVPGLEVWELIFIGAGVLILVEVLIRLLVPAYRKPVGGSLIIAIIFLGVGLQGLVTGNLIWAVALILIGIYVLLRGLMRRS